MSPRTEFDNPGRMLRFSSELDPAGLVGNDTEALLRGVQATTAIKVALVLGERIPVLAQNQVFDSPLVLELFGDPHGDREERAVREREAEAFLWLVRHDYIQMRVHPEGLPPAPDGETPFTLRNACAGALARPGFELSGWPDLATTEREDLAAVVGGRSRAQPPPQFRSRVAAIEQLDLAFRESGSVEQAREVPAGLDDLLRDEVQQRAYSASGAIMAQTMGELRELAGQTRPDGSGPEPVAADLNTRSAWRRLIRYSRADKAGRSAQLQALETAWALVDLAYNRRVAQSLGAPFQRESAASVTTQELYLDDPDITEVRREVAFLTARTSDSWLSWEYVKERLAAGDVPNESNRWRRKLQEEQLAEMVQGLVAHRVDSGVLFKAKVWLPHLKGAIQGGAAAVGTLGGLLLPGDPITGSVVGAAVGGVAGHYVGMADPTPQLRKWMVSRGVKALAAEMRTGA